MNPERPGAEVDVAVAGAGLAGLAAARLLAGSGRTVAVLEARERVGGRTLNLGVGDGEVVEIGGQWVGPMQGRVLELIAELDLEIFPTHYEGRNVLDLGGKISRYKGTIPRLAPWVLFDIDRARRRFDRLARTIPPEEPWRGPGAAELDRRTVGDWIAGNVRTARARYLFSVACGTVWGMRPGQLSLLWALHCVHTCGGFDAMIDTEGGAQQDRVVGGSQEICRRMAAQLGAEVVSLGAPVRTIHQADGGVTVHAGGRAVTARRAIVAMAPALTRRIEFEPQLSGRRDQFAQRCASGALTKCTAVYDEPFWRDDGLTGEAVTDAGPIETTFDNSPPGGKPGVLVAFIPADAATEHALLPADERRRRVTAVLVRLFGDRAGEPTAYHEQSWADEAWSGGGPVCSPAPGTLTTCGDQMRAPAGRVHWAAAETATVWCGYMEGAVRAGEDAAREAARAEGWTIN